MTLVAREDQELARLRRHMSAVREHWDEVVWLKRALRLEDPLMFLEVWMDMGRDVQIVLHGTSTRGGGIWTTKERQLMRAYEAALHQNERNQND